MRYAPPGKMRDAVEFRARWCEVAPDLDCDLELRGARGALAQPLPHRGRALANRFCVHPMEGWDGTRDGRASEATLRRWRRFGRSGAKLIWGGEAFAVRADGRANPNQLCLLDEGAAERTLAGLLAELRAGHREVGEDPDELFVGLQLTHSGRFSRPDGEARPIIAHHHPLLDARLGIAADAPVASDGELEAIAERYVALARLAQRTGFDFVDVKCCHGYLLHELLGARTRGGVYGGSFEHRTRLFRRIVAEIARECPGLEVGTRVSIGEVFPHSKQSETGVGAPLGWDAELPYPHGFGVDPSDPRLIDLEEPFRFLELASELGIELVNLTLGSPYTCPHLQRPAAYPPSDGYLPPDDPLTGVAEHVRVTRRCKAAFPHLTFVGSGYSYLMEYLPHVAQHEVAHGHVDLVGLGRMVLSYPELPLDVLRGAALDRKRICRTFSDCTTAPRNGLPSGCYPLDPYYPAEHLRALKRAPKRALRDGEARPG